MSVEGDRRALLEATLLETIIGGVLRRSKGFRQVLGNF